MDRQTGGARSAGIVIAAALVTVAVLLCAVLLGVRGGRRDTIVLPDETTSTEPGRQPSSPEDVFLTIDRENIQTTLDTMHRPDAYHQVLTVEHFWETSSRQKTVELWCSGALRRAVITDGSRTENLVTNGQTVWLWYDGEASARALTPEASVTFDDLVGIPTYETLVSIPAEAVVEAGFVTLDASEDLDCLYIAAEDGEYEDRYWVDVNTQLLCRADSLLDGAQTYQLRQISCQVLTAEDTSLTGVFTLPDGTQVSPISE